MPFVENVPAQFCSIPDKVGKSQYLGAWAAKVPGSNYRRKFKIGAVPHLQGVQRIGRRLIVSGGIESLGSQLIVFCMGSRSDSASWSIPKYAHEAPPKFSYKSPSKDDLAVDIMTIDRTQWHAGGLQAFDRIVAVPIYLPQSGKSEVRFKHFPKSNEASVDVPPLKKGNGFEAKAVGVTRIPTKDGLGRYLLAVWDDRTLDFHFSASHDLTAGFGKCRASLDRNVFAKGFVAGASPKFGNFQNINLLCDADGTVYLVGTRAGWEPSAWLGGKNWLDLYRISWDSGNYGGRPDLCLVSHRKIKCSKNQCNFLAAAGMHVDDCGRLALYATPHWIDGNAPGKLNFNEYTYLVASQKCSGKTWSCASLVR